MTDVGFSKYGMPPAHLQVVSADSHAASAGAVTTSRAHTTTLFDRENPALWLLLIGGVTFGLIAFSTHVRIGSFNASASAG